MSKTPMLREDTVAGVMGVRHCYQKICHQVWRGKYF